jgi:four helix bundle protein
MAISKPARTFQDLLVWQKAHQFVLGVYALTTAFPKQETYGLSLQMRRASVSIPLVVSPKNGTDSERQGHPRDQSRAL